MVCSFHGSFRSLRILRIFAGILFLWLGTTQAQSIQRLIASYNFSSLTNQEIRLLKDYLGQIEDVSKKLIPESQVKLVLDEFDGCRLSLLSKQGLQEARRRFNRSRIMIASDWCYFTGYKMPDLLPNPEDSWDLHHIVYLRLNGQNAWWNIMPMPRQDHHKVIHGKGQPGEMLHHQLAERLASSVSDLDDWSSLPSWTDGTDLVDTSPL